MSSEMKEYTGYAIKVDPKTGISDNGIYFFTVLDIHRMSQMGIPEFHHLSWKKDLSKKELDSFHPADFCMIERPKSLIKRIRSANKKNKV